MKIYKLQPAGFKCRNSKFGGGERNKRINLPGGVENEIFFGLSLFFLSSSCPIFRRRGGSSKPGNFCHLKHLRGWGALGEAQNKPKARLARGGIKGIITIIKKTPKHKTKKKKIPELFCEFAYQKICLISSESIIKKEIIWFLIISGRFKVDFWGCRFLLLEG